MANGLAPERLTICSYQVGFGDCFLLTFGYPNFDRHVLIDFGTTGLPFEAPRDLMKRVARDIRDTVTAGGTLDPAQIPDGQRPLAAVVATHRHRDHISGFGGSTGTIIRDLRPELVLQPWTEDPEAEVDAERAARTVQRNLTPRHTLANMDRVAAQALRFARRLRGLDRDLSRRLEFIGEESLGANTRKYVNGLREMGRERRYLQEGDDAGLGELLPGVQVHVLGPPSLEQSQAIRRQVHEHEEEFWHLQAGAGDFAASQGRKLFPGARPGGDPAWARWFRRRLRNLTLEQLLELVTELDGELNNTSLILLFEVHGLKLLFPGDAQLENWQHALGQARYEELLANVDVYKVGHHGSLNATPKSLWGRFVRRSDQPSDDRLLTLLSTREGLHGKVERRTEVPRNALVTELERRSDLVNTQGLAVDEVANLIEYEFV